MGGWWLVKRLLEVSDGRMEVETVSPNEESQKKSCRLNHATLLPDETTASVWCQAALIDTTAVLWVSADCLLLKLFFLYATAEG